LEVGFTLAGSGLVLCFLRAQVRRSHHTVWGFGIMSQ